MSSLFDFDHYDGSLPAGCALTVNSRSIWSLSVKADAVTCQVPDGWPRKPTTRLHSGGQVASYEWWGLPSRTAAVRLAQEVAG